MQPKKMGVTLCGYKCGEDADTAALLNNNNNNDDDKQQRFGLIIGSNLLYDPKKEVI